MAAGKHDRRVIGCAKAGDDAVGARAHIGWLLAVRAPVAKQEPARALAKDFAALAPLVVAVVPFEQIRIKLGGVAEPSECAGASRTLKGTGENPIKLQSLKALVEPSCFAFALFGEGAVACDHGVTDREATYLSYLRPVAQPVDERRGARVLR